MKKQESKKHEIKNIASSGESVLYSPSDREDSCGMCGSQMQVVYDDLQQGKEYKCLNPSCGGGSRILPMDPPCGCRSQPCEHTEWHLPHHIVAKRPGWFDRIGYKVLRFMRLE